MRGDIELGSLAATQAGYLGHEQVLARGMTESAIRYRVRKKAWIPVRKGLYRVDGIPSDYRGLLRGAVALLPDATVSHESAAEIHAMPFVPRTRAVVTVHAGTTHDFPGVTIHRSIDLAPNHRVVLNGLSTTDAARTLVDLAAVMHPKQMSKVFDEALAAGIAELVSVERVFLEVARRGRTGSGVVRRLLSERRGSETISASRLERVGLGVFEGGGLPRPVFQYRAPWDPTRRIDFAWPHWRVGCECDSRRWHTRVNDFQNDRSRDNLALEHNWRIYRFTWEDFRDRPGKVIAQLQAAMAASA